MKDLIIIMEAIEALGYDVSKLTLDEGVAIKMDIVALLNSKIAKKS